MALSAVTMVEVSRYRNQRTGSIREQNPLTGPAVPLCGMRQNPHPVDEGLGAAISAPVQATGPGRSKPVLLKEA